jgi:hypothetical protein
VGLSPTVAVNGQRPLSVQGASAVSELRARRGRHLVVSNIESRLIQRAREKLDEGFYVNNLRYVVTLLRESSLSMTWPTACFVLRTVAVDIIYDWDKYPVTSVEVDRVAAQLRPSFCRVLDSMSKDVESDQMCAALDDLVLAVMKLED